MIERSNLSEDLQRAAGGGIAALGGLVNGLMRAN